MPTTTGISFDGVNDEVTKAWAGLTASSNKKFTFAAWFELPTGTSETALFNVNTQSTSGQFQCGLAGSGGYGGFVSALSPFVYLATEGGAFSALQKGASTMSAGVKYFLMVVYDSAQATAANRLKVWFGPYNGTVSQQTWTFVLGTTYPPQNDTISHGTGVFTVAYDSIGFDNAGTYYKGRNADVYWLDNVALADPSSLLNNYASAAAPGTYAGSYGNTGYHLDFSNAGSLGADSSGNSNSFTPAGGLTQLTSYFASAGKTVTAAAGSYSITGTAATLRRGKKLAAAAGSYSWSGAAATTRRGLKASAAAGSYAWTGTAATLRKAARLSAGAGSYAWTGAAAALRRALKSSAAAGSYSWTGAAATLTKSSGAAKVIAAGVGSYAWTGATATLRRAGKIAAAAGSYTWTGATAAPRRSRRLAAGAGSYAWTGAAASLRQARRLAAGAGAYVWTGSAAFLIRPGADKTLAANAGSYAWTGATAILARAKRAAAAAGAYAWTGAAAGLVYVPSLFRPSYPVDFPQPLLEYAAEVDMGVLRADRATDQQQRRVHATMPHNFSLTFLMSVQQWGAWSNWVSANGYRWFLLNLPTLYAGLAGSKVSPVLVRFVPPINAQNVGLTSVRITVSAEIAPSMIKLFLAQT